jgi:opacity protein-like surface antigen
MLNKRIMRLGLVTGGFMALMLSSAAQSQAQVIGFKLGGTFSTLQINDGDSDENRLNSFGGGGFIRFGLAGISLQPEVLAVTKGSDIDGIGDNDVHLNLNYIEVPVLARFSLGSGASMTPYLMAGPAFGFEVGCDVEFDFNNNESSTDCGDSIIPDRKSMDIGLAGVLGVEFRAGPGSILMEGRYTHGLTNISDSETFEVKNRSFGLMAGYSIPLGSSGITSSRR